MIDLLFQTGLSNACFSLVLAIVAMVVGAKARRPHLAYMLWLLVFLKLVTPPIVTIPVDTFSPQSDVVAAANDHGATVAEQPLSMETTGASTLSFRIATIANDAKPWLASIWLLGGGMVLAWSLLRIYRFSRMLATESEAAPQEVQAAATQIAHHLGLRHVPMICTTPARLSPMVWWAGGRVRVVVPTTLLDQMDGQQWQWILAHELAHVRRRDYLVRWLEWLACVCFWWNPVLRWAQRNLRAMEEICCDALVISCLNPKPKTYANSLLSAVEFLARPVFRPPAVASEVNSGGFLERRFKMIVSTNPNRTNSRRLQMCVVLLCALVVLPLGIASAQDYEAVGRRLREAVAAGELTGEQARAMMEALRKASARKDEGADRARAYLMKVRKELGEAVEAGEISREDATKRYEATEKGIRERMAAGRAQRGERRITIEDYRRAEASMRKMVKEGKAKPEHVERRLIQMRKMMGDQSKRGDERGDRERPDWEAIKKRIEGAVESGKITREEADARYKAIRERTARENRGGDKRAEYEGVERRIKAAVEAGKITPEEAREKLRAYRKRLGQES